MLNKKVCKVCTQKLEDEVLKILQKRYDMFECKDIKCVIKEEGGIDYINYMVLDKRTNKIVTKKINDGIYCPQKAEGCDYKFEHIILRQEIKC